MAASAGNFEAGGGTCRRTIIILFGERLKPCSLLPLFEQNKTEEEERRRRRRRRRSVGETDSDATAKRDADADVNVAIRNVTIAEERIFREGGGG